MKIKLFAILLGILCFAESANAITHNNGAYSWWGYSTANRDKSDGPVSDFILKGGLDKHSRGTHDDEFAVVAMVARKIVQNGGWFCPYQIQCANDRKKTKTWTLYYRPTSATDSHCAWLCVPPYAGDNCANTAATCDGKNYSKSSMSTGYSMKTSGGRAGSVENEIDGFDDWHDDPERDVILGITQFMANGVFAQPVQITCGRNNWKEVDSYVSNIYASKGGTRKLLCAGGYKANAAGTDCVKDENICKPAAPSNATYCPGGYSGVTYNKDIHDHVVTASCTKFVCKDETTAFPSAGAFTCTPCGDGTGQNGRNTETGVCVQCQTGQTFSKKSNKCVAAHSFSQPDLQYGKGNNKSTPVGEQCWTKITPSEYRECMKVVTSPPQ